MEKGKLFVVSGPSGSGKSTICREAIARTGLALSVSATTRAKSEKEVDGKDYFFLTKEKFEQQIKNGELLEYAQVFDNYYGTPMKPVMDRVNHGEAVVLEIDVQGGMQVFERYPEAVGILVLPPSDEELKRRLYSRGRDDDETIQKRLKKAQWEIEQAKGSGHYTHTIINDDLETAIQDVVTIMS